MVTPAPAQLSLEIPPAIVASDDEWTETAGRKRITSVQIITLDAPWWERGIKPNEEYQVVAVFRNHSRLYRSYAYRPGLRHARATRIAGRW